MRLALASTLLLLGTTSAFAMPRVHRGPTSPHTSHTRATAHTGHASARVAGIEPERATQIQAALIRAGYLTGTPKGEWDAETQAAMEKLQADNGWQTKLVPDSRAIIKLGLGPGAAPPGSPASAAPVQAKGPEAPGAGLVNQ